MRVTDAALFESSRQAVGTARERHLRAVEEASTGLRVKHPWDDPAAAAQATLQRIAGQRYESMGHVNGRAQDELRAVDGALGQAVDVVSRARELAVQLSNDTYGAAERAAAVTEMDGLLRALVGLGNTEVGGRYLFGGFQDDAPPFSATGTYGGDTGVRQLEIAPGVTQAVSVRGDVAFSGAGGGIDAFATLSALSTALGSNNAANIRASLGSLDGLIRQLSSARADAGQADALLEVSRSAARQQLDGSRESLSRLEEVDAFDAASALMRTEQALEATLTAAARSYRPTLLDKL
jgi:flagellar hook-associated protein 3 FlgL